MAYRTDKLAALDPKAAWILNKHDKQFEEGHPSLSTRKVSQVLESMMGPGYDANGTPHPNARIQRETPAA